MGPTSNYSLAERDLNHILQYTKSIFADFRDQNLFLTGGTGFFGMWLVESFLWANEHLALNATLTVLTRDPEGFFTKAPHLKNHCHLKIIAGDVRNFTYPKEKYDFIIHCAANPNTDQDLSTMMDTVIQGTKQVLAFANRCNAKKVLFVSSGAVYGQVSTGINQISESDIGTSDPMNERNSYGLSKLLAEHLCRLWQVQYKTHCTIARCFAFLGPYQSLDSNFASSTFLKNALLDETIKVSGDGTPMRSYLYAADLAIWLWTILLKGQSCRPYNVGSPDGLSIAELATKIAAQSETGTTVEIAKKPEANVVRHKYVPNVERASKELGLSSRIDIDDAIARTLEWHRTR